MSAALAMKADVMWRVENLSRQVATARGTTTQSRNAARVLLASYPETPRDVAEVEAHLTAATRALELADAAARQCVKP